MFTTLAKNNIGQDLPQNSIKNDRVRYNDQATKGYNQHAAMLIVVGKSENIMKQKSFRASHDKIRP